VLDVRDDGGSLSTVVDIAGLYRARSYYKLNQQEEKKEVLYDRDKKIEWDGPLVIMVNSFSRLHQKFCAAIQDYKEDYYW
jgi:carboxyl-terminal processing protease